MCRLPQDPGALQKHLQLVSSWGIYRLTHSFIICPSIHRFIHAPCPPTAVSPLAPTVHASLPPSQRLFLLSRWLISHLLFFSFSYRSFDRLGAGASAQLKQLHEVIHSISCCILYSFQMWVQIPWYKVGFLCFLSVYLTTFGLATNKLNKKSKNALKNKTFKKIIINK